MSDLNLPNSNQISTQQQTSSALLEQLVYIDNFMSNDMTSNMDMDGQLSLDLAAFADDAFIFPDEEKPKPGNDSPRNNDFSIHNTDSRNNPIERNDFVHKEVDNNNKIENTLEALLSLNNQNQNQSLSQQIHNSYNQNSAAHTNETNKALNRYKNENRNNERNALSHLPKVHVPPGAQSSLVAAGLSQTQIDVLAALIAQHQTTDSKENGNNGKDNNRQNSNQVINTGANHSNEHNQGRRDSISSELNNSLNFQLPGLNNLSLPTLLNQSNRLNSKNLNNHNSQNFQSISPQNINQQSISLPIISHSRKSSHSNISEENSNPTDKSTELDKRRRNTAASARFRIKKKMKEQQLEKTVKDLNDQARNLEVKIQQLEMENKLLRNLVVEKGVQRDDEELELLRKRAKLESENSLGESF